MPRVSQRETVTAAVQQYLEKAELHAAEEYPIDVKHVAKSLHFSRTTLYKYHLNHMIAAARERQEQQAQSLKKTHGERTHPEIIRDLKADFEQERERNRALVTKIVLMEANAARLGFDPEELYRPLPKPLRNYPHAGQGRY